VQRVRGKWRNSSLFAYFTEGDDLTFYHHMRMRRELFHELVRHAERSGCMRKLPAAGEVVGGRMQRALAYLDHPTISFQVAACLYYMGHGCPVETAADVASIGSFSMRMRRYLLNFAQAVIKELKPIYMGGEKPLAERVQKVRAQFASRRGIPNVGMACDGTHVPFKPPSRRTANDFKNYKGWESILVVAFDDSFYCFVDGAIGAAGKAGDNTVLQRSGVAFANRHSLGFALLFVVRYLSL